MLGMKTLTLPVTGMTCSHCEARVVNALEKVDGITRAVASHKDANVTVTLGKSAEVTEDDIKKIVRDAGYTPT